MLVACERYCFTPFAAVWYTDTKLHVCKHMFIILSSRIWIRVRIRGFFKNSSESVRLQDFEIRNNTNPNPNPTIYEEKVAFWMSPLGITHEQCSAWFSNWKAFRYYCTTLQPWHGPRNGGLSVKFVVLVKFGGIFQFSRVFIGMHPELEYQENCSVCVLDICCYKHYTSKCSKIYHFQMKELSKFCVTPDLGPRAQPL